MTKRKNLAGIVLTELTFAFTFYKVHLYVDCVI